MIKSSVSCNAEYLHCVVGFIKMKYLEKEILRTWINDLAPKLYKDIAVLLLNTQWRYNKVSG